MKITVARPAELGEAELALWRGWQRADPRLASPFLAPEFAVALSHHNDAARVAVLGDGTRTVGFLPYEQHTGGVGRALAYGLSDVQALVGPRELEWRGQELLNACRLAVFEFDHLVSHQVDPWSPRSVDQHATLAVDLSGGWDAWQEKRASSGQMKTFGKRIRKLGREWGEVTFEFDSRAEEDLHQLMRWKGAQYVRTGRVNRFGKPWFRDFVTELFHTRSEHFSLGVARLRAGERTVALDLSPRGNQLIANWFPSYDLDAASYSPGIALLLAKIRVGAEHGLTRMEMGTAGHAYKHLFADYEGQVAEGVSERPGGGALLRRVVTAPRRIATDVVLSNPRLRLAARETLGHLGRLRTKLPDRHRGVT